MAPSVLMSKHRAVEEEKDQMVPDTCKLADICLYLFKIRYKGVQITKLCLSLERCACLELFYFEVYDYFLLVSSAACKVFFLWRK